MTTLVPPSSLRSMRLFARSSPFSTDSPMSPSFVEGPTYEAANVLSISTTSRSAFEIAVPGTIAERAR